MDESGLPCTHGPCILNWSEPTRALTRSLLAACRARYGDGRVLWMNHDGTSERVAGGALGTKLAAVIEHADMARSR